MPSAEAAQPDQPREKSAIHRVMGDRQVGALELHQGLHRLKVRL